MLKNKMENISIKIIEPTRATEICRAITATLPQWFGIPEANARYEQGMLERKSFVASIDSEYVGMITLEFPYPNNANIFWMAVSKEHHHKHIGTKLLIA